MAKVIQRVELTTFYDSPIHCPFCGTRVIAYPENEEPTVSPCPHTLFIAHDMGFEYRSQRFNQSMGFELDTDSGLDDIEDQLGDAFDGVDGLTDKVSIVDAVKFAAYVGPPSGYGSYVGFAPVEEG